MHLNNSAGGNVRTLPARKDAAPDRQQAAADDAAQARDERNEAIADGVTFDVLPFSTEQIAVLDAALRRGRIEDVHEVWNTCKDVLDAEIKRRIAAADLGAAGHASHRHRSVCGDEIGPGNAGVSSFADHRARALRVVQAD
ncbi:hypothetical protein I6G56_26710 [Burkholderia humptydooensis]|uniref:Uncharacterized protein n=2 Tax=Burkholderia humptydooensis TaxID=430531 RepID=A0A7U4PBD9_9BURK|nr:MULTISPECIES: hypothetical protein [Burkholderia]AJY40112.1 hypothetical protein BW21_4781 [Burkholderia sp. 2002721687]ALX46430.1 hypothetical protein AQ610_29210 [Burkholderia humptydooensis]QPS45737.1 hypothetical protein I6G56_26710 [Burkholderia humptydooensis]